MKKKVTNILNIALDIFMVLFLIFSAFTLVVSLSQKTEEPGGRVSRIFGITVRSVQSESMEAYDEDGKKADGAFFKGDIIFLKITDEDTTYEVGDTVMFWMPVNKDGSQVKEGSFGDTEVLVTHRIVRIEESESGMIKYYTQGLNKKTNAQEDLRYKTANEFVAKYNGKRIGGLGKVIDFVQSGTGFFLCIILPILIFVVIQTIRVIRNIIAYKAQKVSVAAASGELSEEQKRLIAEEYLKQQATDSNATPSTDVKPADEANSVEEETPAEE